MSKDEVSSFHNEHRAPSKVMSNIPNHYLQPENKDKHSVIVSMIGIKLKLKQDKDKDKNSSSIINTSIGWSQSGQSARSNIKQIEKLAQDIFNNEANNQVNKQNEGNSLKLF